MSRLSLMSPCVLSLARLLSMHVFQEYEENILRYEYVYILKANAYCLRMCIYGCMYPHHVKEKLKNTA
ncbi:hypothetical protein Syun_015593 [Stephania yunnanensis]|uniref:Secreted protein n=1 Tax=Stephania yunnanensis TaxID=152371 RepID=A0AAP0JN61_9MAGN